MDVSTKRQMIILAVRKYLSGDALIAFEKDVYRILDKKTDKPFVDIIFKHFDIEKFKNNIYKNDYLLYNLLKYDYDGKNLKLSSSKLMKLYLVKEGLS